MTKKKFKHPKILRDYWATVKRYQRSEKKKRNKELREVADAAE